jgi:hypothetical protein
MEIGTYVLCGASGSQEIVWYRPDVENRYPSTMMFSQK